MHSTVASIRTVAPPRPLVALIALVAVLAAIVEALPHDLAKHLTAETGPFETASAAVLGAAALLGASQVLREVSRVRLAGAVALLGLFLRELDFQKRFTYRSIESIGFYTRPIASWTEKLAALSLIAVFAVAGFLLARKGLSRLRTALQDGESWIGFLTGAAFLVVMGLTSEKFLHFTAAEEVFEAGFACVVLMFAWDTRAQGRPCPLRLLPGCGSRIRESAPPSQSTEVPAFSDMHSGTTAGGRAAAGRRVSGNPDQRRAA